MKRDKLFVDMKNSLSGRVNEVSGRVNEVSWGLLKYVIAAECLKHVQTKRAGQEGGQAVVAAPSQPSGGGGGGGGGDGSAASGAGGAWAPAAFDLCAPVGLTPISKAAKDAYNCLIAGESIAAIATTGNCGRGVVGGYLADAMRCGHPIPEPLMPPAWREMPPELYKLVSERVQLDIEAWELHASRSCSTFQGETASAWYVYCCSPLIVLPSSTVCPQLFCCPLFACLN
jgi:hypothetical protein